MHACMYVRCIVYCGYFQNSFWYVGVNKNIRDPALVPSWQFEFVELLLAQCFAMLLDQLLIFLACGQLLGNGN